VIVLLLIGSFLSGINGALIAVADRADDAKQDRRIADLKNQVARGQNVDSCRSRYGLQITDANAEWLVVFGALVSGAFMPGDTDPALVAALERASADLRAARDARLAYEQHPVLPCPIAAPEPTEGD
jgi:hypothetical protein